MLTKQFFFFLNNKTTTSAVTKKKRKVSDLENSCPFQIKALRIELNYISRKMFHFLKNNKKRGEKNKNSIKIFIFIEWTVTKTKYIVL